MTHTVIFKKIQMSYDIYDLVHMLFTSVVQLYKWSRLYYTCGPGCTTHVVQPYKWSRQSLASKEPGSWGSDGHPREGLPDGRGLPPWPGLQVRAPPPLSLPWV